MRKNLFFSLFRISSVCVLAALFLTTGFCSKSHAQTNYEFHTARVEFREYHDGVGDHTRIAFMLREAGTEGPIVFTFIDIEATEIWYQSPYNNTPVKIEPLNFWVGPSEFAYGEYDEVSGEWDYDPALHLEHYYRFKIFDRGPDGTGNPIGPPGTYTFTIVIQDTGQRLTAAMDFDVNWQPRPLITGIWFDTDGNLHVENDWVRDGPTDEFSPGSQFVTGLWNADFSKGIGSYMPTTMTHTFIPAATLSLIGFEGTQQFSIQMDARTFDWMTRVYSPRQSIVPDLIPVRDEAPKTLCEIPIPGEGAGFDVFYDRRNYDPIMVSEPTGGTKFGVYIGNYPDMGMRDLVASRFQEVVFQNTTNGSSYRMTAPELYKWKDSYSGEFSMFAGHPSMVIGDWIVKIMYESQWYEATFTITQQMLEQTPPIPVPRVRVRWQNPFDPCDNSIKIIAPATNGEQYRLRIFDEFGGLVVEDNMAVKKFFGKEFVVHRYDRTDVLGQRARIETRHFGTDWLTLVDWSTWPPNCNANGLFHGSMARSVTWFEMPPPRDSACGGFNLSPLE